MLCFTGAYICITRPRGANRRFFPRFRRLSTVTSKKKPSGGRLIKAYDVAIPGYRKSQTKIKISKMHILWSMDSKFCVKFQKCPLKFHTKFWTHTLPNMHFEWWRHQMETFSALLAICAGNSPVPGEFPTQRPVTRNFDVFFDLRLNKLLSKQLWGWWFETLSRPLWRHRNGEALKFDELWS